PLPEQPHSILFPYTTLFRSIRGTTGISLRGKRDGDRCDGQLSLKRPPHVRFAGPQHFDAAVGRDGEHPRIVGGELSEPGGVVALAIIVQRSHLELDCLANSQALARRSDFEASNALLLRLG